MHPGKVCNCWSCGGARGLLVVGLRPPGGSHQVGGCRVSVDAQMQHMCNAEVKYIDMAQPKAIMLFNIPPAKTREVFGQLRHIVKQDYAYNSMRFSHAEFGLPVHGMVDVSCLHKLSHCPLDKLSKFKMDSVPHVRNLIEDTSPALTAGWTAARTHGRQVGEKPEESEVVGAVEALKCAGLISRIGDVASLNRQLTLDESVSSSIIKARALMLAHLMMDVNVEASSGIIHTRLKTGPGHLDGSAPEGLRPSQILWGVRKSDGVHVRPLEVPEIMSILGYNPSLYNVAGIGVSSAEVLIGRTMPVSVVRAAAMAVASCL